MQVGLTDPSQDPNDTFATIPHAIRPAPNQFKAVPSHHSRDAVLRTRGHEIRRRVRSFEKTRVFNIPIAKRTYHGADGIFDGC